MFKTLRIVIATPGTPVPLAVDEVPDGGTPVLLKAGKKNQAGSDQTGVIHIGRNAAEAHKDAGDSYRLFSNEILPLKLRNLNECYVDGTVAGDILEVIFEE